MPNYRRILVPGATYFFTVTLQDRNSNLLTRQIACLRQAVQEIRRKYPFEINAWVILPEHMHTVWTLPATDADYSGRWREIKKAFNRALPQTEKAKMPRGKSGAPQVWQPRFWEHTIRNDADFAAHINYTHINPVKHGLAKSPTDWPYSTIHRASNNAA
jgi:putative transposase